LDELDAEVKNLLIPSGTSREAPGRTCRDIHFEHPHLPDGLYWIDPNLGVPNDAFQVWCNMSVGSGETCVRPQPKTSLVQPKFWAKKESKNEQWFSDLDGGRKIRYPEEIQLQFLRLLHTEASQQLIYFCQNSVGWFNSRSATHDLAISLMAANKKELRTSNFNQSDVEFDGCSGRNSDGFTRFNVKTKKLNLLPVIDIKPRDYGLPNQKFGFDAGPVCFRTSR
jgi:collagen type V/XI/XXIV/XXVII alpha